MLLKACAPIGQPSQLPTIPWPLLQMEFATNSLCSQRPTLVRPILKYAPDDSLSLQPMLPMVYAQNGLRFQRPTLPMEVASNGL